MKLTMQVLSVSNKALFLPVKQKRRFLKLIIRMLFVRSSIEYLSQLAKHRFLDIFEYYSVLGNKKCHLNIIMIISGFRIAFQ